MTSVSDNAFEEVSRLHEILVIVRESADLITVAVKAEAKQQHENRTNDPPPLLQDLLNLETAFGWARSVFEDGIHQLRALR